MKTYRLAVIPGDGVGKEVVPEGLKVLRRAGEETGAFDIETADYPWSCEWYLEHGEMMSADGLDRLRDADTIYLGAVGFPGVPDHVSLWGLLLPIRQGFDQYVNLRPVQLFEGIEGPLRDRGPADVGRGSSPAEGSSGSPATPSSARGSGAGSSPAPPSRTRSTIRWSSGTRSSPRSAATTPTSS